MHPKQKNGGTARSEGSVFSRLIAESVFLSALSSFPDKTGSLLRSCFAAWLFHGYPDGELSDNDGLTADLIERTHVRSRWLMPFFRICNRAFSSSPLLAAFRSFGRLLLDLPVSFFGAIYFSFGLFCVLIDLLRSSMTGGTLSFSGTVGFGAAVMLCSSALFLSQSPLGNALAEGKCTGFLLTGVFGFRRERLAPKNERHPKAAIPLLTGLLFALAALRLAPTVILLLPLFAGGTVMVLLSPEAGVLLLLGLFPFLSTMQTAGLLIFTFFSFFCKLIQGKRSMKFEAADITVVGFLLILFVGGFTAARPELSLRPALMFTALMTGYFLTVNLLRTRRQIGYAAGIVSVSAAVVSLLGILEYLLGSAKPDWLDLSLFPDIAGRVTATFSNPNVLGEYLVMVIPFLLLPLLTGKSAGTRLLGIVMTGLGIVCLVFTWSRGAWLGFLVGTVLLLLLNGKTGSSLLIGGLVLSPVLAVFLPSAVTSRLLSIGNIADTSTSYRVGIWKNCFSMLGDWWYSGFGTGCPAFASLFPIYSGRVPAEHAHSLYLEILLEHGIFGLLLFLAVLVLAAKSFFSFYREKTGTSSSGLKTASVLSFVGIVSFLVQGLTDYTFYNYRIFCFFWMLLALNAACRRAAAAERTEIRPEGVYLTIPLTERKPKRNEQ